jgi:hypothetical protein
MHRLMQRLRLLPLSKKKEKATKLPLCKPQVLFYEGRKPQVQLKGV